MKSYMDQFNAAFGGQTPAASNSRTPQAPMDPNAAELRNSLTDPNAMLRMNVARERGNSRATDNTIINDYQEMDRFSFRQKYGASVVRDMAILGQADAENMRLQSTERDTGERITDNISNVATGLVGGLGDIATFAGGMVNDDVGRALSQGTTGFRDFMKENTQSAASQRNSQIGSIRAELDKEDNLAQYEDDLAAGEGGLAASMSYLGRGLVNGAYRFWEDPQSLERGTTEGIGSLFAGGAIGKGLSMAGRLANVGQRTTRAMMPVAIGAMEGGSAYSGALSDVMGRSFEELYDTSPSFRQMVDGGMDPAKAREEVAGNAAAIAGAIQAPIGAATGLLVSKFEANPLGSRGFTDMVSNILRETVEEGAQSASGAIAQNIGVRQADENQMLIEGVGDQLAQGAILGSTTAGAVQVPSAPGSALRAAGAALSARGQRLRAENEQASGVDPESLRAAATAASENFAPVSEAVKDLAASVPAERREEVGADSLNTRLERAANVQEDDIRSLGDNVLGHLKETGAGVPKSRAELVLMLGTAIVNPAVTDDVRLSAGLFLTDEINRQEKLFDEDIDSAKDLLDQEGDQYKAISAYQDLMQQLRSSPEVTRALEWVDTQARIIVPTEGPVDSQTVKNVLKAMTAKPSVVGSEGLRTILKQADEGNLSVTPEQREALRVATDVLGIQEAGAEQLKQANVEAGYVETAEVSDVNDQVMTRGRNKEWGLSADQHLARINSFTQDNDPVGKLASVKHFANFANSQRNKGVAAVKSARANVGLTDRSNAVVERFTRLGSMNRINPEKGKITIYPDDPGSVAFARRVIIEANTMAKQVNAVLDNSPELNITRRVPLVELDGLIFGKAARDAQAAENAAVVDPTVDPNETNPIKKKFPLLVAPLKIANRLVLAFKGTKFGPMLDRKQPLDEFIAATNNSPELTEFVVAEPNFDVNSEQALALQAYLNEGKDLLENRTRGIDEKNKQYGSVLARLNFFARRKTKKGEATNYSDKLIAGEDVAHFLNGRAMAILEKAGSKYQYNPALIQTAMLAALDWYASSQNRKIMLDKDDLAKALGVDVDLITNKKLEEFNAGVSVTTVSRSLADNITKFWGMDANKNAPDNLVKGIPEAIAKEILGAMEAMGWFKVGTVRIPGKENATYTNYYFGQNMPENIRQMLKDMGAAKKLIALASVPDNQTDEATYAVAPQRVAKTQLRNPMVENTPTQRKVLKKAQALAFNFYKNSYEMQQKMGRDAWITLMGSRVIDANTVLNVEHRKAIEGKNLTMGLAFDAMEEQVTEINAVAEKMGVDPQELNKYYQFNYTKAQRLQMLGGVNPVGDKIARHVFLPTKATVDLSDRNSQAGVNFFLSLAQGLGMKVEKLNPEDNSAKIQEELFAENGKYTDILIELAEWLSGGKTASLADWTARLGEIDPGISEHGVMSLLSAAEYMNARDTNDAAGLASFTTHSYFEADGVSNGPANALMNMTRNISTEWLKSIRKVGAFLGKENQTMVSQSGQNDLYQETGNIFAATQAEFAEGLPENVRQVHDALLRVMRGLGMSIKLNDNSDGSVEIEVHRSVLKNPTTITVYGSGVDGIAGNVANELLDLFYEALSDHINNAGSGNTQFGANLILDGEAYGAKAFWTDINRLLNQETKVKEQNEDAEFDVIETEFEVVTPKFAKKMTKIPSNDQLQKLTFSNNEFFTLKQNVRHLFVQQMTNAIEDTVMGHVSEVADYVQKSTNGQSIVLHFMFRKELMRAMADRQKNPDKYPNYTPGDFLSQVEMREIAERLMPYGALIKTDHQTFFIGGTERGDLLETVEIKDGDSTLKVRMPGVFTTDLMGQRSTKSYAFGPSISGVAGVPLFNIGTGDGRAMDIYLEGLKGSSVLPVMDGINMGVDFIQEGSVAANEAVMQSWRENPAQHASASLKAFMRQSPVDQMADPSDPFNIEYSQMLLELTKNFEGVRKPKEIMSAADIKANFEMLDTNLAGAASDIGFRIEAMETLPMSVDQMAGAQSGYSRKGTVELPPNATDVQIVTALNEQIKLMRAKKAKTEVAVGGPSKSFVAAFKKHAKLDRDTGAYVTGIAGLHEIRKMLTNKLPNSQREMLNASLDALGNSDYEIVFGTPAMVEHWEKNNYFESFDQNQDSYFGKIDVYNRVIYIVNPSAETLSHELTHAATITKVQAYYSDPSLVTDTDGASIKRLEGLMREWLTLSYENEGPVVGNAHRMAISTIMGHMNKDRTAEAVNEFMAWSLNNQNIINLQKKLQVKNPLYVIMGKALTALKQLVWGHKKAPQVGTDMFSNVRFNTRVLMATPTPASLLTKDFNEVVMYQSPSFGSNARLSRVRAEFEKHVMQFVKDRVGTNVAVDEFQKIDRQKRAAAVLSRHEILANEIAVPFKMDMQEISTFKMIGAALSIGEHLNTASLGRMQEIYDAVVDRITPADFLLNLSDENVDEYQAQEKYKAVTGSGLNLVDKKGRSALLSNFVALATVSDEFRTVLRGMKMPAKLVDKTLGADAVVERAGNAAASALADLVTNDRNNNNMLASMDVLTDTLASNVGDQRSFIEQHLNKGVDSADNIIKGFVERTAKNTERWVETLRNPVTKKVGKWLAMLTKYTTEEGTREIQSAQTSFFNQPGMSTTLREVAAERIGRTEDNAPVFDMITPTRTMVDQTRQILREDYPKKVREWFNKALTKDEWSHAQRGLAHTDAALWYITYGKAQALNLLSSEFSRKKEINFFEERMTPAVIAKAKQLANFNVTGEFGPMLQSNARAIAVVNKVKELEADIDNLVSLYTFEQMPSEVKDAVENLVVNDEAGFMKLYMSVLGTRNDELSKNQTAKSQMNHFKGHLSGFTQEGVNMMIGNKTDHSKHLGMGYVFMGDYAGSSADISSEKKGYYFSPVSGKAKFNQGVAQTVHQTIMGVDPETGYSEGRVNAGRITDARAVAAITRRVNNQRATSENLRPIYNEDGVAVAFERMADPIKLSNLDQTYDLAKALGAWRGRQSEELTAKAVNSELILNVHGIWKKGIRDGKRNQYIRIDTSKDPVIKSAWAVIPKETKDEIKKIFGNDGFMVRADMANDVIGAHSATVGDFWTGNGRWSPAASAQIRDVIAGFTGNKGYRYLVNTENFVQGVVTDAKVLVVIKSVLVPAINTVANINLLSMNGVPFRNIISGFGRKTVELNTYIKNREKEGILDDQLFRAVAAKDSVQIRKLNVRIQSLKDSYKALSIWPLLEAGEYGSVTDGGLSTEDIAMAKGGYATLIDKLAQKTPEGVRDVARYGLVTRDTQLFKMLSRATQYGDFLAKAILYDDIQRRKEMSDKEALAYANEEFINYNRFAGRTRAYGEAIGLTWFYNYKIRSMKTAQRALQRHPVRALLHTALMPPIPVLGVLGNPLTDNFLTSFLSGRLGYSTGPGMLFRAPSLNPWWNLTH